MKWLFSNEPLERSWKNALLCIVLHTLVLVVIAGLISLVARLFVPDFDFAWYLILMLALGPWNGYVFYRARSGRLLSGSR